jgi:hypothetical protein
MIGSKSRVWTVLLLTLTLFGAGVALSACVADRSAEANISPYDGSWFKGRPE